MWWRVYFITNNSNNILYTGVTSDLQKRLFQHKAKTYDGFTKKYNLYKLVYYEKHETILAAIAREKYFKWLTREKKNIYIERVNPTREEIIL